MISEKELASMIDHTYLKAYATEKDMYRLCDEAIMYNFAMVAVNSGQSKRCSQYIKERNSSVHTGAAIGFPLGQMSIEAKLFEAEDAIRNGADEIDYVINITELKEKNYDYLQSEMNQMEKLCHQYNRIVKVIFENCYLEKDEIVKMAEISLASGVDFIKTSTGFGTSGALLEDVKLMKSIVGDKVKVKAAGGIRTLEDALKFVEAGAERIGTSAGVKIIEDYRKLY